MKKLSKKQGPKKSKKIPAHTAEDIPKGVRDFLGDELHLFKRDDKGAILSQGRPRRPSRSKKDES